MFVGAGVSTAYTLIHYLSRLRERRLAGPVRVAVVERSGEFWAGVPYGVRSGRTSLIITALKEFLPEPERRRFVEWLQQHQAEVLEQMGVSGGALSAEWCRAHAAAMAAGQWEDLFLPRGVFGRYLQELTNRQMEDAAREGLIEYDLLRGEAVDLERQAGHFHLTVDGGGEGAQTVVAGKVVLALGSPPNRPVNPPLLADVQREVCLLENLYEPGLDANLDRVAGFLRASQPAGRNQVLVVGSNASALEVLYSLLDRRDVDERIGKFLILSPEGRFPHRIGSNGPPPGYCPENLQALPARVPFGARQILDSLREDVRLAEERGLNVAEVFQPMSHAIIQALDALSPAEQDLFVADYGVRIGKLQRRAGSEYRDVVDRLLGQGRLEVLKGEYLRYVPAAEGGPGCEYVDRPTRAKRFCGAPLAAIFNCAGFADVNEWQVPLVENLLRRGLCVPNASRRGFQINEDFETSPGCYLMGPLVAGNRNAAIRVWHAESCSRIILLSRQLAQVLARER